MLITKLQVWLTHKNY